MRSRMNVLEQGGTRYDDPHAATNVNYGNNNRAPLLLLAGSEDHQAPVSMIRENCRRYIRSTAITEFKEFRGRSHLIAIQVGWREVAEYALSRALAKAGAKAC